MLRPPTGTESGMKRPRENKELSIFGVQRSEFSSRPFPHGERQLKSQCFQDLWESLLMKRSATHDQKFALCERGRALVLALLHSKRQSLLKPISSGCRAASGGQSLPTWSIPGSLNSPSNSLANWRRWQQTTTTKPCRRSRNYIVSVFLGLFVFLSAKAQSPQDWKNHLSFSNSIIQELEDRQYDLLESQYRVFHHPEAEMADGTPKIWLYFAAFHDKNRTLTANLEEAGAFTQKTRDWLALRPNSVPAFLAFCNALVGECDQILDRSRNGKPGTNGPDSYKQVQTRVEEFNREFEAFPNEAATLWAEPQYYVVRIQFLSQIGAPFDALEKFDYDITQVDPYYAPFYTSYVLWLFSHRQNDPSLPRPEVWLTNRFKVDILDTQSIKNRKCRAYAQIIAFHGTKNAEFKPDLLDWPTLKTGLQDLVYSYGSQTDWPTRYLATAFAFENRESVKEALALIQGNYSPEIIPDPQAFQYMSSWAVKK